MQIDDSTGHKRSHDDAFPNGSDTQHDEPEQKKQATSNGNGHSALADLQKSFALPASNGGAPKMSAAALVRNLFNKKVGGGFAALSSSRTASPFSDIDARMLRFKTVLPAKARFNGSSKGFLVYPSLVPRDMSRQLQVDPDTARMSPDDNEHVRYGKFYLQKDANPDVPGQYLRCPDRSFYEAAIGQALEFKMFVQSKPADPPVDSPEYPFNAFVVASFERVRVSDKLSKEGKPELSLSVKDVKLVASPFSSPSNPSYCQDLISEVRKYAGPGSVYYVNLSQRPPDSKKKSAKKGDAPAAAAGAAGEASGSGEPQQQAAASVDPAAAAVAALKAVEPEQSDGEDAEGEEAAAEAQQTHDPNMDPALIGLCSTPGEGVVSQETGEGSGSGTVPKEEKSIYDWMPTLPPDMQATHNYHILFAETTPPTVNDERGSIQLEVIYDTNKWTKKFKLPNPAKPTETIDKELAALEVAVYGLQWKARAGTSPENPDRYLLRISAGTRVAANILGTSSLETWKLLAPEHMKPELRSQLVLSCSGSLKESYAMQSPTDFAREFREQNNINVIVQYNARYVLFDLEAHVSLYGWPVSRAMAFALIKRKYDGADGAFVPALSVGDQDECKHVLNHMKFYHPQMLNLMETDKEISVSSPELRGDKDIYFVLTPKPCTPELMQQLEKLGGVSVDGETGRLLADGAFSEDASKAMNALIGLSGINKKIADEAYVAYRINAQVSKAAVERFHRRQEQYANAMEKAMSGDVVPGEQALAPPAHSPPPPPSDAQ